MTKKNYDVFFVPSCSVAVVVTKMMMAAESPQVIMASNSSLV